MKSNLKRLETVLKVPFEDWKVSDFEDDDELTDDLVESYSLNSTIVTLNAAKIWLMSKKASEKVINEYTEMIQIMGTEKDSQAQKQQKSETEEDLGEDFDWEIMTSKIRKYITNNLGTAKRIKLKQLLLLGLFGLQPPARIGNYLNMYVHRGIGSKLDSDKNYLMKDKGKLKFIYNKFKTSKHIGKTDVIIEDPLLIEVLMKYIKTLEGKNPLLIDMSQSQVTNNIKAITKKVFGTAFSVNTFRHSFLTWFMGTNPSIDEKKRVITSIGQVFKASTTDKYVRVD
jgi:hypothetical protein